MTDLVLEKPTTFPANAGALAMALGEATSKTGDEEQKLAMKKGETTRNRWCHEVLFFLRNPFLRLLNECPKYKSLQFICARPIVILENFLLFVSLVWVCSQTRFVWATRSRTFVRVEFVGKVLQSSQTRGATELGGAMAAWIFQDF